MVFTRVLLAVLVEGLLYVIPAVSTAVQVAIHSPEDFVAAVSWPGSRVLKLHESLVFEGPISVNTDGTAPDGLLSILGQCANNRPCTITLAGSIDIKGANPHMWIDNLHFAAASQFEGESLLRVESDAANLWITNTAFMGGRAAEQTPTGITLTSGGALFRDCSFLNLGLPPYSSSSDQVNATAVHITGAAAVTFEDCIINSPPPDDDSVNARGFPEPYNPTRSVASVSLGSDGIARFGRTEFRKCQTGDERQPGITVAGLVSPAPQPCIAASSPKLDSYTTVSGTNLPRLFTDQPLQSYTTFLYSGVWTDPAAYMGARVYGLFLSDGDTALLRAQQEAGYYTGPLPPPGPPLDTGAYSAEEVTQSLAVETDGAPAVALEEYAVATDAGLPSAAPAADSPLQLHSNLQREGGPEEAPAAQSHCPPPRTLLLLAGAITSAVAAFVWG